MPTPLGHGILGLAVYAGIVRNPGKYAGFSFKGAAAVLLASNFPDLDFIPGIVIGRDFAYHHGPTHSLVFGIVAGMIFAALTRRMLPLSFPGRTVLFAAVIWMHIFSDMAIVDYRPDDTPGVQLLYPFSGAYLKSPVDIFFVEVGTKGSINPKHLLTPENMSALFFEIIVASAMGYVLYFLILKVRGFRAAPRSEPPIRKAGR